MSESKRIFDINKSKRDNPGLTYSLRYDRIRKEFNFTVKIRLWNIIITVAGAALASFYILHLLADSILGGT